MPDTDTSSNTSTPAAAPAASPAPEAKPATLLTSTPAPETKAPEAAAKQPESKPAEAAPVEVKYEFKDVPAGYDAKALEAFARENKVSPEVAQKLIARDVAQTKAFADKIQAEMKDVMERKWIDELKADKVIGGVNFDKSVETARRAVDALTPELREGVDKAGLGNHPVLFKIMHHFGSKMREDSFVRGDKAPANDRNGLDVMYGPLKTAN